MTTHEEPNPCIALGCSMLSETIEVCRDHRCPYRWQREAAKDRERSDEYYRNARLDVAEVQKLTTNRYGFELMKTAPPIRVGT